MAKKLKCPECGIFNDKENAIYDEKNKRYYCKVCYENKVRESQDYKELVAYLCELYHIEAPTGWMLKQIKDFKEQFNYSYRGIKSTLHYFYEIKEGNDVSDSLGIGIVPFIYEEAKKFYIDKKAVKDSVLGCDLEKIQQNRRIIRKVNDEKAIKRNRYKDVALIDIEKL